MSIKLDSVSTKAHATTKPLTWTHTVGVHPNNILIVGVGIFGDGGATSVSGITYNGVAMTKICGGTTGERNEMLWYLLNPSAGANTVSVTWSGDTCMGGSVSFYNVKQLLPTNNTKTGTSATANVDITPTFSGSALVGCTCMETNSAITTNDTVVNTDAWSGTYEYGCGISYALGKSGASNLSWTNENKYWVSYAIAIGSSGEGSFILNMI
jgi:hypothetical protein